MSFLIRSRWFWFSTGLALLFSVGMVIFIYPSLIKQYNDHKSQVKDLDSQIQANEQYLLSVQTLEKSPEQVDQLYGKASQVLPSKAEPEILQLQLDGLLQSLALTKISLNVPLVDTAAPDPNSAAQTAAKATPFTLVGSMDFNQVKSLIEKLQTFTRWNKVTSVDISRTLEGMNATISGEAYSRSTTVKDFTASKDFLTKATATFNNNQIYATLPDVKTEGNYGRNDPFAPAN